MGALGRVVRAGVGRRRTQTVVVGLVVLIAVTASVLGATLLVASDAPFDRAFEQQHGAHLTAAFTAGSAQVTATAHTGGASAAAGPFPIAAIHPVDDHGQPLPQVTVVGRADPGGPVDELTLLDGRWASRPGELVLNSDGRFRGNSRAIGRAWTVPDLPGSPTLTIVGVARSISETAGGWVVPGQISAPAGYQMLYRFPGGQVDAGLAAITASVPAGTLTSARSWQDTRRAAAGNTALFVPFLIAFGVLGLVMAVLIVGTVVAGAVSAGTRRIGILKALGFTPRQVVLAYLSQALLPATAGAILGLAAGALLARSLLAKTNDIYGTTDAGVAPWAAGGVLAVILGLVAVTAWVAASRAGRLRTVDALAAGRTPSPGRGRWAARLTGRLPLPRPVTLGLAHPFARPVRSVTIVAAIGFGAAAVTFAAGLAASLTEIQAAGDHGDVQVIGGPHRPAGGLDAAAIAATIAAQPGTAGSCAVASTRVGVTGLADELETLAGSGQRCSYGYRLVAGSWYTGPGQIVVATPFLTATGKRVGDTVTLTFEGRPVSARIAGEVFDTENDGLQILTAAATLGSVEPDQFDVLVTAGTDVDAYAKALNVALQPLSVQAMPVDRGTASLILTINALAGLLTVLLIVVAALGVLNTVVLETRERVHDLGVHKALGMAPRQTIAMVVASVVVLGVAGGLAGTPAGVLLQRAIVTRMGDTAGFRLPASVLDVYRPGQLLLFAAGGLLIAVAGALLPAGWAARTSTAAALRTE